MSEILEHVDGECGVLALRSNDGHLEVIADGVFVMDTRNGTSERLLVTAIADDLAHRSERGVRLLIGGLGVGFSLRAALDHPAVQEVLVVEREPAIVGWNARGPLQHVNGNALADERVHVVEADLLEWLHVTGERFDGLCIDIDNGPRWTLNERNAGLYSEDGLALLSARLRSGGRLSVWGAQYDPEFTARLCSRFNEVRTETVAVPRGEPDVVWLASA